jgi:hypothetical protein
MTASTSRIGLLFVHGIGEQERWEHLKSSAHEFAELLLQVEGNTSVAVVDRTEHWPHPAGEQDPSGEAPIVVYVTSSGAKVQFDCHEVWWADLGARAGLWDVITFWLWGLGQWCAPIYRELDAASQPKEKVGSGKKPLSKYATLPESAAGNLLSEPPARLQLVLAGLAAAFVACTWSLAKRLFSAVLGRAPTPTLIVQYVGDVRTYESRAAPGDSALSDPGRPRRVGIRRRMVSEMVALGTGPCSGWFVVAHSLGTVLAYNGLTETGHALPNYLTEKQWGRVPPVYRRDPHCHRRGDTYAMMPARPPWLGNEDVIDRKLLFKNLRGFLTYGSPLDKFAALWPRIVATATDRVDGSCAFPDTCRWINLAAPSDPVAGSLDSYGNIAGQRLHNAIPTVENKRTPWNLKYAISHIQYFRGVERSAGDRRSVQKRAVMNWLLHPDQVDPGNDIPDHKQSWLGRFVGAQLAYPALVVALWLVTAAVVVAVLNGVDSLLGQGKLRLSLLLEHWWVALSPVLAIALSVILLMGLRRWTRESHLNVGLAIADRKRDMARFPDHLAETAKERRRYWGKLVWMLRGHRWAGALLLLVSIAALALGVGLDWGWPMERQTLLQPGKWGRPAWLAMPELWQGRLGGWWTVTIAGAAVATASIVQTLLNKIVPPVGKAPG